MKKKKFDNVRFCVRPLCELQLFAALDANDIRHHPHLNLSAPLHRFFPRGGSKEVKTIISRGMWRVSVMPMGRLSVLSI